MTDLIEVKVFQTYDNQQCVTTMHYLSTGIPAAVTRSFAVVAALGFITGIPPDVGNVFTAWKATVNTALEITEVQAKAVYSPTDFYTLPLAANNTGTVTGFVEPSFEAYGIQTNRVRSDIRRGNRRLSGVGAETVGGFGVIDSGHLTILQSLCDEFSNILTYDDEGNTISFTPVVVSKEKYTTPSGKEAYQYYSTELDQAMHLATGVAWIPKNVVTTQNSRKRGRGV